MRLLCTVFLLYFGGAQGVTSSSANTSLLCVLLVASSSQARCWKLSRFPSPMKGLLSRPDRYGARVHAPNVFVCSVFRALIFRISTEQAAMYMAVFNCAIKRVALVAVAAVVQILWND